MIAALPSPVLAVTADTLRDLQGGDALSTLWTLFSKCAESLQDGRRLENISWRLWAREMAAGQSYRPLTPDSASSAASDSSSASEYPFYTRRIDRSHHHHHSHLRKPPNLPQASCSRQTMDVPQPAAAELAPHPGSATSTRSLGRLGPSSPVGKIICDMLPQRAVSVTRPAGAHGPVQVAVQVPAVHVPSTPTNSSGPRVVVVNPTPHPTPPATPIMQNRAPTSAPSPAPNAPALIPQPPLPSLTVPASHPRRTSPAPSPLLAVPAPIPAPAPASLLTQSKPMPQLKMSDTLKPSDRRFFIHQSPEQDSPEHDGSSASGVGSSSGKTSESASAVSEIRERQASVESSAHNARTVRKKGKDAQTHAQPRRPVLPRAHSARGALAHRKGATLRRDESSGALAKAAAVPSMTNIAAAAGRKGAPPSAEICADAGVAPPRRKQIVLDTTTSSEYETTDTEDDSWSDEEDANARSPAPGRAKKADKPAGKKESKEETKLREAAVEAQRQRELFRKVPERSYSTLGQRTQSGLLSQLMNPSPDIFPPNHPYRQRHSSTDIARTNANAVFAPPPGLSPNRNRSAAALPTMTAINAQGGGSGGGGGAYRPRGRPEEQEMEEDSDSDNDNPDDTIQLSQSVAQMRLAALAGRRSSRDSSARTTPGPTRHSTQPELAPAPARPALATVNTAPMGLAHPYNLPAPVPPLSAVETRRQMFATELSESMRRNLIWNRQTMRGAMLAGGAKKHGLGGGLRPLTQVTMDERESSGSGNGNGNGGGASAGSGSQRSPPEADGPPPSTSIKSGEDEKAERRRKAMARNRSWAGDYHYSGW